MGRRLIPREEFDVSHPCPHITAGVAQQQPDSYERAMFDAALAARTAEWNRVHASTKTLEPLFEVNTADRPSAARLVARDQPILA
jgi:hypothetical protein